MVWCRSKTPAGRLALFLCSAERSCSSARPELFSFPEFVVRDLAINGFFAVPIGRRYSTCFLRLKAIRPVRVCKFGIDHAILKIHPDASVFPAVVSATRNRSLLVHSATARAPIQV